MDIRPLSYNFILRTKVSKNLLCFRLLLFFFFFHGPWWEVEGPESHTTILWIRLVRLSKIIVKTVVIGEWVENWCTLSNFSSHLFLQYLSKILQFREDLLLLSPIGSRVQLTSLRTSLCPHLELYVGNLKLLYHGRRLRLNPLRFSLSDPDTDKTVPLSSPTVPLSDGRIKL